jgi:hypothetical protein
MNSLSTVLISAVLAACGGGAPAPDAGALQSTVAGTAVAVAAEPAAAFQSTVAGSTAAPAAEPAAVGASGGSAGGGLLATAPPVAAPGLITSIRIENTNLLEAQTDVPVTFGQVFAVGHLLRTQGLSGRLDDGTTIPLQVDVKATHPDGSVRHAVISAVLPRLGVGIVSNLSLVKEADVAAKQAVTPDALLAAGLNASFHANIGGIDYYASADDLLKSAPRTAWLAGPVAGEWLVSAPLMTSAKVAHPHLSARFAVRWYPAQKKARVDVTVENNWAYEPAPQNFTYDAQVLVAGQPVYSKAGLTHLHHARWRKVFWWGGSEPKVNIKHNTAYLIASRAVANYVQPLTVPEATLANLQKNWQGPVTEPMGAGLAMAYMPSTGGRGDIGLLPSWAAMYLLSMDKRAKDVTLGQADLAGSWSSHYRDRRTDRPVSIVDYPYMTIVGSQSNTLNPATKQYESFPTCASTTACTTTFHHDSAHQPGFAYLPYLVTGDYYYLEELQFWTMYNVFSLNAYYRGYAQGLMYLDEVRGQAWSMRTLSEATYITPDADPLKQQFAQFLSNNLDWYNREYTDNPAANTLGALVHGGAAHYMNGTSLSPWQDDFFTSAIGHAAELGFTKADRLLQWKAKFPIARMTGAGACWIDAAIYTMVVRSNETSPIVATIGQAYAASHTPAFNALACGSDAMALSLNLKKREMTGYSSQPDGFPSNMQPALAYSAQAGGGAGLDAWKIFMLRSVKPDYASQPQFAIVPR